MNRAYRAYRMNLLQKLIALSNNPSTSGLCLFLSLPAYLICHYIVHKVINKELNAKNKQIEWIDNAQLVSRAQDYLDDAIEKVTEMAFSRI